MLLVKENPLLAEVEALQKCYKVLDLICEKCMKQKDMNEVLAMKMHYISCIFQKCITFLKEREDKLDGFIKRYVYEPVLQIPEKDNCNNRLDCLG